GASASKAARISDARRLPESLAPSCTPTLPWAASASPSAWASPATTLGGVHGTSRLGIGRPWRGAAGPSGRGPAAATAGVAPNGRGVAGAHAHSPVAAPASFTLRRLSNSFDRPLDPTLVAWRRGYIPEQRSTRDPKHARRRRAGSRGVPPRSSSAETGVSPRRPGSSTAAAAPRPRVYSRRAAKVPGAHTGGAWSRSGGDELDPFRGDPGRGRRRRAGGVSLQARAEGPDRDLGGRCRRRGGSGRVRDPGD